MSRTRQYAVVIVVLVMIVAILVSSFYVLDLKPQTGAPADPAALTYYTEQFPPYNHQENGVPTGIAVDLLRAITKEMGNEVTANQVHVSAWTEAYQAAQNSKNIVIFSTVKLHEREELFKWVGPIASDCYVLFATRDSAITVNGTVDLKAYRIGVVTDDAAAQQLLDLGINENQLVYDTNTSVLIEKLVEGEIDLWCYPETVGRTLTQQVTGNYYTFNVAFFLDSINFYYAFSKDISDTTVNAFQQALDKLKEKDPTGISSYDKIIGKYVPAIGLGQLNYVAEDWAPFNYEKDGAPAGISVEILDAVFNLVEINQAYRDIQIVPLTDAFTQAQGNTSTVVASIVRTPEREALYKWAGPFTKSGFVLFAPTNRNITVTSAQDLNHYRIGAVATSVENSLLINQGVNTSNIVNRQTPSELVQMLKEGQIDMWATGDLTGQYEIMKANLKFADYETVYTLGENDFYFAFSRDVPDSLVNAFQHALDIVREQKDAQGVSQYERIIYRNLMVGYARPQFTNEQVVALVEATVSALEKNATDTLQRINAQEAPYRDTENPGLYAFVYNTNVTMVAHADNPLLVDVNLVGKTDVAGKAFRGDIITGALTNGTGWVDYIYINPAQPNLYYKTTYFQLAIGSDGNSYVVCSGNYKS